MATKRRHSPGELRLTTLALLLVGVTSPAAEITSRQQIEADWAIQNTLRASGSVVTLDLNQAKLSR